MSLDTDILVDRRRLKRRLVFWRVLGIVAVFFAVVVALSRDVEVTGPAGQGDHIARIKITGFISDSRERHEMLVKLRDSDKVKAVIVSIDSPGGTTVGGEALYEDLRAIAAKKPVAAVFGTSATSAAYLCGIASDYIVARGNTITGSVGAVFQWPELSQLLEKLGVKVEEVRSGTLKANPSLFSPTDEKAKALVQQMVNEALTWFAGLVSERRKKVAPILDDLRTGRVYTGREALQVGLVDAIGDEATALKWLKEQRQVKDGLKVLDWKPKSTGARGLIESSALNIAERLGIISPLDSSVLHNLEGFKGRPLDGLLSIWHG